MNITPQDILIHQGGKTIWLSHDFLLKVCSGITEEYMRKVRAKYKKSVWPSWRDRDLLPDTGKSWRWGKANNTYYYAWQNIPNRAPAFYRDKLPSEQELLNYGNDQATETPFEKAFKEALRSDYKQYLHCYNECTPTQQKNLSIYAAVIKTAVDYITLHKINTSRYDFFNQLASWIKSNNIPYAPKNPRILKEDKIMPLLNDKELSVTDIVKLKRSGNKNAHREFADEEIRSWIMQMKATGANYTEEHTYRKVKQMCLLTNKPVPSRRWIGTNFNETHNMRYITAHKNFGKKGRFANPYTGHQRFQNALYAGDCWQVDGTRVNILPHMHEDSKGEKSNRYLYIIAVRDVHSGDVLGYTYTYNENRWVVHEALRMAVQNTGYLPYEIIFDKYPGHNTPEAKSNVEMLEHLGVTVRMEASTTIKQNLERWFGTMQTVFLQDSHYYYGEGVKSRRRSAHRSEEFAKRMAKEAKAADFDWQQACNHYNTVLEAYRQTPYKEWSKKHSTVDASPAELHDISEKPNVRMLEEQEIVYLFGLRKKIKFRGQGLLPITINHVDFQYRCTDYNIVSNYAEVEICYDLEDLSHIHIYKASDNKVIKQYLGRVEEERMAQRYGPGADWGVVAENAAKIKRLEEQKEEEFQRAIAVGEDITGILYPMMVTKQESEEQESRMLNNRFGLGDKNTHDEGDGDLDIDITSNY